MPTIPTYPKCAELGCNNPKSKCNSFCLEHGGRERPEYKAKYNQTEHREKSNAKYNTKQWEVLRRIQLSKYPLCIGCQAEGRITAANVVDHLFPWTQISEQAFYINRFQSLCTTHHSVKTKLERNGIYRAFGLPHRDYTKGDYAMVMGVNDPSARN
jgi:5-methylcytosine-specific restriction protein A